MFCLQIHALAECTMNEKSCILHKVAGVESLTHLIYNLSSLLVLASKSRRLQAKAVGFCSQNKIKQM